MDQTPDEDNSPPVDAGRGARENVDNQPQKEATLEETVDLQKQKEAAKRAVLHAAEQTRAAAIAASERAASEQNSLMEKEIEELQQARQNAALQLGSEVAAHYTSPLKSPGSSSAHHTKSPGTSSSASHISDRTAQAAFQPGGVNAQAALPPEDALKSAEKGAECQKFLYEVANQTAVKASAQMSAARALASTAENRDTLQAAKGQAELAQKNMALAQQMAAAAHSPSVAVQAVAAMQQACSGKHL